MLPFLVLFGMAQLFIMVSVVTCVIYLPADYKLLSLAVIAVEAFILFPWWYAVIHLFAIYDKAHYYRATVEAAMAMQQAESESATYWAYPTSSTSSGLFKNSGAGYSRTSSCNSHTRSMLI